MSTDLYRDAHVGIAARLAELEARIRDREAELTDAFWASLDGDLREHLASLRSALDHVASESFEEVAQAEARLATYAEELERLIARLPAVEEEWRRLPDDVPNPPIPSEMWDVSYPSPLELASLERSFTTTVREHDRNATIVRDRKHSLLARFRDRDAPFSLRAVADSQTTEVSMCLFTSVSRATPALCVRHESFVMTFGKALGVKHEIEVGEPSFDGLFLIEGTKEAAARLLSPLVRSLLLALARFDIPTLTIDPPNRLASLTWRFEPVSGALDAAIRILVNVRETNAEVRFRR